MNSKERIFLSSPHMGGGEQKFINEAFQKNWVAPLGLNVTGFEEDLKSYLGENKEVAVLSSGTAALHLALVLLGVGKDDEVLCQSLTFVASANPIMYQGARPIFVDSEPATFNICPEALEAAIKDRIKRGKTPKAIIAVHLYGMPYQVEEVRRIAESFNIPVIEDSAEALGSSYKDRKCGTFGDYAVLSFNGNKIITTSGGGALVNPGLESKERSIFLATQARDPAPHYQHSCIGYNYRLSNISAGIGRGQMEVLDEHVQKRRSINKLYQDIFSGFEGIKVVAEPNNLYFSNHWLSVILIDKEKTGATPEDFRLHLEKYNIESRPVWKPMHLQPVYKDFPYYGGRVAEKLFAEGLCLPSGSNLTENDRIRLKEAIDDYGSILDLKKK